MTAIDAERAVLIFCFVIRNLSFYKRNQDITAGMEQGMGETDKKSAHPPIEEPGRPTDAMAYRPVPPIVSNQFRRSLGLPHWLEADPSPTAFHVGAFQSDQIVGVGSVVRSPLPNSIYRDAWRIVGPLVDRPFVRRGIEQQILRQLLTHAGASGSALAWCETTEDAIPLYADCGFARTSWTGESEADHPRVRLTCRLDKVNNFPIRAVETEGIQRIDTSARLSRVVVFNGAVHIGGLLPNRSDVSVGDQTREILEKIDSLLAKAGSEKSRLVSAMVWLKDISTVSDMNEVWQAWVPEGTAPARACVESVPGSKEFAVEISVIAAQRISRSVE